MYSFENGTYEGNPFLILFKDGKPVATKEQKNNASESFRYACGKIMSGLYDIVILDEINNLIDYNLIGANEVVSIITNRPEKLSIILTGRNASKKLIDIADTVTEMKEIKHAFNEGKRARRGIEY